MRLCDERRLAGTTSGRLDGTRFTYTSPLQAGRIEDFGWNLRLGVDRLTPLGNRATGEIGLGLDYGQVRSWLDSGIGTETGPRKHLVRRLLANGCVACT